LGFYTPINVNYNSRDLEFLMDTWNDRTELIKELDFEIDGMVLKIDSIDDYKKIGETNH
jgi:NAD-dependent DNA ligase